jgi:hypothetical protein
LPSPVGSNGGNLCEAKTQQIQPSVVLELTKRDRENSPTKAALCPQRGQALGDIEAVEGIQTGAVAPDCQRLTPVTDAVEVGICIAIRASALRKETSMPLDHLVDKHSVGTHQWEKCDHM